MVKYKIVEEIIEKCWTHARMREALSNMSFEDRLKSLKDNNKLTRLEFEEYQRFNKAYNYNRKQLEEEYDKEIEKRRKFLDRFNRPNEYSSYLDIIQKYDELFGELESEHAEKTFHYDRRLFEDYEASKGDKPVPEFNWEDYAHDRDGIESFSVDDGEGFVDMLAVKLSASRDSIGDVENSEIEKQSQNTKYTKSELDWLRKYFDDGRLPSFLTYMINHREPKEYTDIEQVYYEDYGVGEYEEYNLTERWKGEFNNIKNHLDNAINKSEGLTQPTILYHAGRIDLSLLPGDKGVWNGYKSMSFQEQVMGKHSSINDDYWNIIVLAPTGTKGVCANDMRFHGASFVDEHEYLLGRNTTYTVLDIDYKTGTEIVMLDGI